MPPGYLPTTSWSLILAAASKPDTLAQSALARLCTAYWYPLYAYLRRRGFSPSEAEDLTQGFFARFIEKNFLKDVAPARGRFRAFLLAALRHYVSNELDFEHAQRRGGGRPNLSLDFRHAESRFSFDPPDNRTPDRLYERDWALALLDRVLASLRDEWARIGKSDAFDVMKMFLSGDPATTSYRDAAVRLQTTEGALKVAVHRLRKRYRLLLQQEIASTVEDPNDVIEEIRFLFVALS